MRTDRCRHCCRPIAQDPTTKEWRHVRAVCIVEDEITTHGWRHCDVAPDSTRVATPGGVLRAVV